MIITCKDCQSQYEVADEKVHGRSVRIRCRACGSRIFLSLEATTPPPARAARHAMAPPRDESADATTPRAALAAPLDDQPATGGRNETSVLFTLAALTGFKSSKSAAPKKEDSGLIDLNALSTSGSELTPRNVKAPVLSEPPLGAFTTSVRYTPPAHTHTRRAQLYGAGIAAVALLAMIGLGFGMRGEKIESADVLAAAAPVVHAVAIAPAVVAAPAPVAPAPEVVASTASDSKSAPPSKGKAKNGAKRAGAAKASGPKKSGATSAPRAAAPNDACGCRGNLMCAMNCSSK